MDRRTPGGGKRPPFAIEFYRDAAGREPVRAWLRALPLAKRQVAGAAMFAILQHRGLDVCGTPWGKQLGAGLFEFRIRVERSSVSAQLPPEKVLLRIFCHAHGDRVILLLVGYDKGRDPSHRRQQAEIAEARRRLADWMARARSADR